MCAVLKVHGEREKKQKREIRKKKYSSIAQSVEHAAVNRSVVGSSPTGGAFLCRKRVWEGSGRNEIDETCKIQENVSCRFFWLYRFRSDFADILWFRIILYMF